MVPLWLCVPHSLITPLCLCFSTTCTQEVLHWAACCQGLLAWVLHFAVLCYYSFHVLLQGFSLVGLFWFGFFFCSFCYPYSYLVSSLNLGVYFLLFASSFSSNKVRCPRLCPPTEERHGPGNAIVHVRLCWKNGVRFCCQEGFLAVVLERDAYEQHIGSRFRAEALQSRACKKMISQGDQDESFD